MPTVYQSHTCQNFQNILESVRILEVSELNTGIWLAVTVSFIAPIVSKANQKLN
jgi:hypothetical protein